MGAVGEEARRGDRPRRPDLGRAQVARHLGDLASRARAAAVLPGCTISPSTRAMSMPRPTKWLETQPPDVNWAWPVLITLSSILCFSVSFPSSAIMRGSTSPERMSFCASASSTRFLFSSSALAAASTEPLAAGGGSTAAAGARAARGVGGGRRGGARRGGGARARRPAGAAAAACGRSGGRRRLRLAADVDRGLRRGVVVGQVGRARQVLGVLGDVVGGLLPRLGGLGLGRLRLGDLLGRLLRRRRLLGRRRLRRRGRGGRLGGRSGGDRSGRGRRGGRRAAPLAAEPGAAAGSAPAAPSAPGSAGAAGADGGGEGESAPPMAGRLTRLSTSPIASGMSSRCGATCSTNCITPTPSIAAAIITPARLDFDSRMSRVIIALPAPIDISCASSSSPASRQASAGLRRKRARNAGSTSRRSISLAATSASDVAIVSPQVAARGPRTRSTSGLPMTTNTGMKSASHIVPSTVQTT